MWLIRIIPDFAHLTGSVCIHIYHYTYVGITVGHCFISLPIYLPNGQSNVNIRNLVYYTRATAPVVITGWTPVGIMAIFAPIWPTRFFPWLHHISWRPTRSMLALPLAYWVLCQLCKFLLLVCSVYLGGLPDQYWLRSPRLPTGFSASFASFFCLSAAFIKVAYQFYPWLCLNHSYLFLPVGLWPTS